MLNDDVRDFMRDIGSSWMGKGYAVECGAWLGGGTAALAQGLSHARYDRPLCVYDRWNPNAEEVQKARIDGVSIAIGQNIEPTFRNLVEPHCGGFDIKTYRGKIEHAKWCGHPIEMFFLDAAKRPGPFYGTLKTFGPSWMPGVTTIGLLDYGFYRKFAGDPREELYYEQVAFVDRFADHFELLEDFGPDDSPAFFAYVKEIDWGEMV